MQNNYPYLSAPLKIRNFYFRNRLLTSPVNQPFFNDGGALSHEAACHLLEQARGGFAQVTIGEQPVAPQHATEKGFQIFDTPIDPRVSFSLASHVVNVHNLGALASIELSHAGAGLRYPPGMNGTILGPCGYVAPDGVQIVGMSEFHMDEVIQQFCIAASRLKSLGFDGVVVHAAHGCLLAQFLSPRTNTRRDNYGGSPENRMRFPLRLLRSLRATVGQDFIIELRISGSECVAGGITVEDNIEFCSNLEGIVDLIHVSAGIYDIPALFVRVHPSIYYTNGCNAEIAGQIKQSTNIPVVVVGAINTPELAEQILASGKADFVAMGRQAIADPQFYKKLSGDARQDITPCIRCLNCMDISAASKRILRCSVNPRAGRQTAFPETYSIAEKPRKVAVVGGGPGGITAAITAAKRGHDVILFEQNAELGGNLRFSEFDIYKADLRRYKNFLAAQALSSGIDLRLNTRVTPELLAQERTDVIISALGAQPIRPSISGIDRQNVFWATEAYFSPEKLGKRIVLIGGGLVGCEIAVHLASGGYEVKILEMADDVARDCTSPHRIGLMEQLEKVTVHTGCTVTGISDTGVEYDDLKGLRHIAPCDTVLYAVGMQPLSDEALSLAGAAPSHILVGDCLKTGKVVDAVHQGYFSAISI